MKIRRQFMLRGLKCEASIGIYEHEKQAKQTILIDADLLLKDGTEPSEDLVDKTLNYEVIRETIRSIVEHQHYHLQETLARQIFNALSSLPETKAVRVCTAKPDAYLDCEEIAYELSNMPSSL